MNPKNQKTKKPIIQKAKNPNFGNWGTSQRPSGIVYYPKFVFGFLDYLFLFGFFCFLDLFPKFRFLDFWMFRFLDFWFLDIWSHWGVDVPAGTLGNLALALASRAKTPKIQKSKKRKSKNPKTQTLEMVPKNQKNQKTKTRIAPKNQKTKDWRLSLFRALYMTPGCSQSDPSELQINPRWPRERSRAHQERPRSTQQRETTNKLHKNNHKPANKQTGNLTS